MQTKKQHSSLKEVAAIVLGFPPAEVDLVFEILKDNGNGIYAN